MENKVLDTIGKSYIDKLKDLETEFQNKIKDLREEALREVKKEEFKEGDWVILNKDSCMSAQIGAIAKVYRVDKYLHINWKCEKRNGQNDGAYYIHFFRKATNEEIEKHLIEEAAKKGFVVGAKFRHPMGTSLVASFSLVYKLHGGNNSVPVEKYFKANGNNFLCIHAKSGACFPLPECELIPSHPQIEIGKYKVELFEKTFKVGCTEYPKERAIELYDVVKHISRFQSINVDGVNVPGEVIKQIADYYTKKS